MTRAERLLHTGRVFVARGRALAALLDICADAEVDVSVRWCSRGGWWVTL